MVSEVAATHTHTDNIQPSLKQFNIWRQVNMANRSDSGPPQTNPTEDCARGKVKNKASRSVIVPPQPNPTEDYAQIEIFNNRHVSNPMVKRIVAHTPGNPSIKGLLLNIRSIRNKFCELESIITSEHIDIVAVTETFLNTDIDLPAEYQISGYKLFTKNRATRGGGVALYCRTNLNPTEVQTDVDRDVEHLCVQITTKTNKINVSVIYRKPSQVVDVDVKMYASLEKTLKNTDAIILGDLNLPQINWGDHSFLENESRRLIKFTEDNFLHQYVREPTRGPNILDLIFSNQENLVSDVQVREHLATCDHNMINFVINSQNNPVKETIYVPDFSKANYDGMKKAIDSITLNGATADEMWLSFKNQFIYHQNRFIPLRKKITNYNHKAAWYTPKITKAIRNRNRLYKLKKSNNGQSIVAQYNNARRDVKKEIRQAKRNYEINIAAKTTEDTKAFYKYINNKKQLKSGIGPLINEKGETVAENKKMASTLNEYFSSVFTNKSNNETRTEAIIKTNHKLPDLTVTEKQVLKQLEKMKINKSPGPDNLYPRILKNVKEKIAKPLTIIFNISLQQGLVPKDWKKANVTPIFKKGCRKQHSNYRPISLTSVICKILESIITNKITKYLQKHKLIKSTQHGFMKNKSCLTNLIEFYHKLLLQHDTTKALDVIYLDFQKAFDKVPHDKLMQKVKALGISGNIGRWIENWLDNREQRVVINGEASDWKPVTSGVPQGSVLGPILFIIYINDIDTGLNNNISKFADDTKIGKAVITENDRISLQEDLNKIIEWSEKWQMPFNINKCQLLQIGNLNKKFNYEMRGQQLNSTTWELQSQVI